jgi:dinuclear metal center YbgI/SA1388 family protein
MATLESVLQFLDRLFRPNDFPDYPNALNGLQVEGLGEVRRLGAAVDASETTILEARKRGVDFLLVHHGLFWDGLGPLAGPRFRKVAALIEGKMALYSLHLPLDAHPTLGNCAILGKALGVELEEGFAAFEGVDVGRWGRLVTDRETLQRDLADLVEGPVQLVPGGSREIRRVGILTGSGAGALGEAASLGLDALVTGEAAHHNYHEAMESGVNLFLAGHYATEVFGVKALAEHLGAEFGVPWDFLHLPTGL